jgi:hypothetical protein
VSLCLPLSNPFLYHYDTSRVRRLPRHVCTCIPFSYAHESSLWSESDVLNPAHVLARVHLAPTEKGIEAKCKQNRNLEIKMERETCPCEVRARLVFFVRLLPSFISIAASAIRWGILGTSKQVSDKATSGKTLWLFVAICNYK